MKKQIKRFLNFVTKNKDFSQSFEVSRLTKITVDKKFFHMDEMKDGKWRITYNGNMFDTTEDIMYIEILRDGDQ